MPEVNDINKLVKDSAYAAIGFGILGFQKAQVRRRELIEQLSAQGGQVGQLGRQLDQLSSQIGAQIGHLGDQLTGQVGSLRASATDGRDPVEAVRTQLTDVAKLVDRQVQPVRRQLDDRLGEIEDRLPSPTRDLLKSLRDAANSRETAIRTAIGLDA